MFNISSKIAKAWNMVWKYKMLWVFALLLALSGGSNISGSSGGGGGTGYRFDSSNFNNNQMDHMWGSQLPAWMNEVGTWFETSIIPLFAPEHLLSTIIWMIVIIFGISILIGLLLALVRYPSETAIIRLVDQYEENGAKKKFKEGWALGWNKRAFHIWVIDLIIGAPATVVFGGLGIAITALVINMTRTGQYVQIPGIIGLVVLMGFLMLVLGIVMIFVGLWRQFIVRAIAIDGANIAEGFKQGWELMTRNFKNSFLTWLVMFGMNLGVAFAIALVSILLIPVMAVLLIPGALVAAIPGALAYGITSIFTSGFLVWVIAGLVAAIFLFTVIGSPVTFLGGLYSVFSSSIWTQTYREMKNGYLPPVLPPSIPAVEDK